MRDHSRREKPNDRETYCSLDDFGSVSLGLSTDTIKIFRNGKVFQRNLPQEFGKLTLYQLREQEQLIERKIIVNSIIRSESVLTKAIYTLEGLRTFEVLTSRLG